MKIKSLVLFLTIVFGAQLLYAQTTAIPDANFENYLETHTENGIVVNVGDDTSMGDGIDNNGLVLTDRINGVVSLSVNNLDISDLTGIEDFTALETLICNTNNLSSLNVSNNTNLKSLLCGSNFLTNLALQNNTNLETLNCSDNQIQSIDVFVNTALQSLTVSGNQLSTIDVSNNANLTLLGVSNNRITGELLISNNTNLENLYCSSNQISTLNVSNHHILKNLDASNNALTSLDLSAINSVVCPDPQTDPVTVCQGLSTINVSRNQLTSLVINNGYNDLVSSFNASENPDLFCIQIDSGFTPSGWTKDDWTYYSENTCEDVYTYVPDDNFEQALIDLNLDDVLDNLVLTGSIDDLINLDVSNQGITSLVGIEGFEDLQVLDCSTNTIEEVDFSNNAALLQLNISNNNVSDIDVSANTLLTVLDASNNSFSSLDLSTNTALTTLNCSNNSLSNLDVNSNTLLSDLDCSFNQIESLNVTTNTALTSLLCNDNNLFALKINNGNNNLITTFSALNNSNLSCIEVDDVANANAAAGWQKDTTANYNLTCGIYVPDDNFEQALIDLGIDTDLTLNNFVPTADAIGVANLDASGLGILDLTGIEAFTDLISLNCSGNALENLDLSSNTVLEILDCSNNQIEELDFTINTALTSLLCSDNALLTLNIENGSNAALATFNATNNPNLYCINVDDAIVGSIPGSWQKDAFASYNGDCANNRFTTIPDAFFEQALIDLGYDNVIDNQVLTVNIEHILTLDISDKSIEDLTGIQDFQSLTELDCSGNYLNDLDVSGMIFLERLNCSSNYFLTNDINDANGLLNTTGTISLIELYCASNSLSNLDTSINTNLEILDCADNNLDVLNISGNTILRSLNCSNNNLVNLDISNNAVIEVVNCDSNQISNLNTIGVNNTTLTNFSCVNNDLSNLLVNNYQALVELNCRSNTLTQLVVTNITALEYLDFTNNQISDINLLNNVNLVEVLASQNELTQLDLVTNTFLENLNCDYNQITQLNIVANTNLKYVSCTNNQVTDLDLSSNIYLIEANFSYNTISNLILSNNLGTLKTLNASNNEIVDGLDLTTIAVSACVSQPNQAEFCPENITINVSNNLLDFVNIQNGINAEITNFNATGNPNLTCIQVDDVNNIGANWLKDATTDYSEDCRFGETYVPDDNFEQALITLGFDVGPLDDYVPTANIVALINLDVSGENISDLTGIEDFEALQILNCSNNALNSLDLTENENLLNINCSNNQLSSLILNENTVLTNLNIANNTFTEFTPSEIPTLQVFNADSNQIVELDFQINLQVTSISCQSNLLEILNIKNGQNASLANLNAQNNPELTCIETDNGTVPSGVTWLKDATAQFSDECFFDRIYVPDDNFEQALIDLGYDNGALDDYVFKENIETITNLNVSNKEILDLTGIEGFLNLTTLNFQGNSITNVNLNNNIYLQVVNASNNEFTDIDMSNQPNLTTLRVSNNSISQLNLDSNLNLLELNISNNAFTTLNVELLTNLEELDCSLNDLVVLNVTQNINLTKLFCQSNMLAGDLLNIQNGNNENLQIFNATNNPDLRCILVDDPFTVIDNVDGTYDSWIKDDTANYQTVCADADNDGVANEDDLCPGTEFGASVDLFGCAYADLSNDNFTIQITGETCLNSNNGIINIVAQEVYTYTVTLVGDDFDKEYHFTNDIDILNLLAGTYTMCITIEEWPDYISCYTIVITEPESLDVLTNRSATNREVSVNMSGSSSYHVELNGEKITTHNANLTLQLQQGVNTLKVSTDLDCQGIYEEKILVSDDVFVHPNPFNNHINIYDGTNGEEVQVNIYSYLGQLVFSKTIAKQGTNVNIDTSNLRSGMYSMSIQTKKSLSTFKIVKK